MRRTKRSSEGLKRFFGHIWLGAFVFEAIYEATGTLYAADGRYFYFLVSGAIYAAIFERKLILRLWREFQPLWIALLVFSLLIAASETSASLYDHWDRPLFIPFQTPLFLCIPWVALFLLDRARMSWVWALFVLIVFWHIVALPVEGVTGMKLSWHPEYLYYREQWGLNYEAFGLAIANPYFAGLHLPLFYLTFGVIRSKDVFEELKVPHWVYSMLAVIWVISCMAVQSRSVFIGSVLASLVFIFGASKKARKIALYCIPLALAAAGAVYVLFLSGKSTWGLRWVYMMLYLKDSFDWPYVIFGHGQPYNNNHMVVPGYQFLVHSHNDWIQIAFWWGWIALLGYFWLGYQVLRMLWERFGKREIYWPFAALIAVFPHMMSDLGIHHFEKAVFLVLLTATCTALAFKRRYKLT